MSRMIRSGVPRDPDRIDAVLSELKAYWKAHPDLRLGQIVSNATSMDGRYRNPWPDGVPDPFYIEDDVLMEGLRKLPW